MKKIAIYGHPVDVPSEIPLELHEVTICTTPKNLRKIANHLLMVADQMDRHGPYFDHAHFNERADKRPEIVISRYDDEQYKGSKLVYKDLGNRDSTFTRQKT